MNNLLISKEIVNIIKQNDKFCFFVHENPDSDALGSSHALATSLRLMKKEVKIFGINQNIINKYGHLFDMQIDTIDENYIKDSIAIVFDTANKERILGFNDQYQFKKIIRIDHHLYVEKIGEIELIDEHGSSTSELVGWMILNHNLVINRTIINYLYTGILSDTGRLMFPSTSRSTYDLLSKFLEFGFDRQAIHDKLYLNNYEEVKFAEKLKKQIKVTESGIGYIIINKTKSIKYGNDLLSDKVWVLSGIKEIKIWFFIYYNNEKKFWKGSIRSRDYDVNQIAKKFDGGGHLLASGFKLNSKKEISKLFEEIQKVLINGK